MSIARHAAYFFEPVVSAVFTFRHEALGVVVAGYIFRHEGTGFPVSQTFVFLYEGLEPSAAQAFKPVDAAGRVAPGLTATVSGRGDN